MAYVVEFSSRPGCFVSLPAAALVSSEPRPTFRAQTADGRTVYLTCGRFTAPAGRLQMHRQLARALRLQEGQPVSVSHVQPAACRRAVLRAASQSDYELLCLSGERLQASLPEQAGCLWPAARLPVWLDARNTATVTVTAAEPPEVCLLARMTELEILPPETDPEAAARDPAASLARPNAGNSHTLTGRLARILGLTETASDTVADAPPSPWTMRVHAIGPPPGLSAAETFVSNRVCFCLAEDVPAAGLGWCELAPAAGDGPHCPAVALLTAVDQMTDSDPLWAAARAASAPRLLSPGAVLVPDVIRRQLRLAVSDRVTVTPLVLPTGGRDAKQLACVSAARLEESSLETVRHHLTAWQRCLGDSADVWWRSGGLVRLTDERTLRPYDVILEADGADVFRVTAPPAAELAAGCLSRVYGGESRPRWPLASDQMDELALPPPPGPDTSFSSYAAEQTRLVAWLRRALQCGGLGHCLVTGPQGVGKTTLARQACRVLSRPPLCAFSAELDCAGLLGKKPEAVSERLGRAVAEAERRRPAVLVLDALDALVPAEDDSSGEPSQRGAYFAQLAALVRDQLTALTEGRAGVVVVAAAGGGQLHADLLRPPGLHLFGAEVTLAAADAAGRARQLRELSGAALAECEWRRLSERTRGCTALDLHRLVTRARLSGGHSELTEEALWAALDGFLPAALQQVQQSRPDPITWDQVGGLDDVRTELVATLQRPLLYPVLYARAGRHIQARALLYGPPGSGKTLLARALAHQADINFFTVKGPELLSKYIGASEHAVRDLFERAFRASPALIFFDEFESLAPRRGHDSTGVTDRVVNQLLTLLDGAETPAGGGGRQVALLAASSRPDLLDPALLRPGRLGRRIRCRLPDGRARRQILQLLLRRLPVDDGLRLDAIAARHGLSGADLKALVADAHLRAVRAAAPPAEPGQTEPGGGRRRWRQAAGPQLGESEARAVDEHPQLSADPADGGGGRQAEVLLRQEHLEAALAELRPSLSAAERARYDAIYRQFESGLDGGGGSSQGAAGVSQRVSLA